MIASLDRNRALVSASLQLIVEWLQLVHVLNGPVDPNLSIPLGHAICLNVPLAVLLLKVLIIATQMSSISQLEHHSYRIRIMVD